MAINPLGLHRSGDLQTDLDLMFANLQFIRDSLPQTVNVTEDFLFNSATLAPISHELSFPITGRVKFEAMIFAAQGESTPSVTVSMQGPPSSVIYHTLIPVAPRIAWGSTSNMPGRLYWIKGTCEPTQPGVLQVLASVFGPTTIRRTSFLTVQHLQ